ncbi:VOC family protein [Rossellomorea sp. SC111]|uniref:VOC family protein n=1 Tax=Rossellomorea sp. SC111 TaxID=2968985 RepID=UPI00215A8CBD|nr:VOC family protein [Rossellomorea sp. SC111]MCR8849902.1 VOC family protein [Rossellomorea sp. SC111]
MSIIQGIKQIGVPVKDLARAIDFYREQLGRPLLFTTASMAFFDCDGVRLLLTLPENEKFTHSSVIYFDVEDIQSSYEKMKENDVHFVDEPHMVAKMDDVESWMVFFEDTEGNTHALVSEVRI